MISKGIKNLGIKLAKTHQSTEKNNGVPTEIGMALLHKTDLGVERTKCQRVGTRVSNDDVDGETIDAQKPSRASA